jgi:probable phosphoglycerate mutase
MGRFLPAPTIQEAVAMAAIPGRPWRLDARHLRLGDEAPFPSDGVQNLILVRHGEAEHHLRQMTGGWTDLPLTDRGREDAATTARFLADRSPFELRSLLSSDLKRASQTAEIISAAIRLPLERSPSLRELNNGIAAGCTTADAQALELPRTQPELDWIPYPGAESWRMLYERVASFYAGLEAEGRDSCVVVSHGHAMVCLINSFLGLTTDENLAKLVYELRPCSISHLRTDPDGSKRVVRLNDVSHLTARRPV